MSAPVVPFEFEIRPQEGHNDSCPYCKVYIAEVFINTGVEAAWCRGGLDMRGTSPVCRTCLRRLRATLKEAEKQLPRLSPARQMKEKS